MFLWEIPACGASARPQVPAVIGGDRSLSWGDLNARVGRVAALLREHGLTKGERVGVLSHNNWRHAELYYGITLAGGVIVPLNWRLARPELERVASNAGLSLVLADPRLECPSGCPVICLPESADGAANSRFEQELSVVAPLEHPPGNSSEDDLAMIAYTSGTTGQPKGAMHTHSSLIASALRLALEMRLETDDVFLGCLPFFFAGANSALTTPLLRGCSVVVTDFSSTSFLDAAEQLNVTATITVPTMIAQILDNPRTRTASLSRIAKWTYAGAAMPAGLLTRALDRFGPVFTQLYGQVETGLVGATLHPRDHLLHRGPASLARSGVTGVPTAAVQLRLVDTSDGADIPWGAEGSGEIWVRSPSCMTGYWNRPDATASTRTRDGWIRTGDIAVRDKSGYLRVIGRTTEIIITGGINVFPGEIEEIIATHPLVDTVAVVGTPSTEWGQEICAYVTLRDSADQAEVRRELLELCAANLAGYKKPRRIIFLPALPMTGSGKVARHELSSQAVSDAPAESRP